MVLHGGSTPKVSELHHRWGTHLRPRHYCRISATGERLEEGGTSIARPVAYVTEAIVVAIGSTRGRGVHHVRVGWFAIAGLSVLHHGAAAAAAISARGDLR